MITGLFARLSQKTAHLSGFLTQLSICLAQKDFRTYLYGYKG
jgi:hypothetical protein